jgi:WD40 repeat protein
VFELPAGKEVWQFTQHEPVLAVAPSADGRWLATASGPQGSTIRLLDATTKRERWRRKNASSTLITFRPDGREVAIASADNTLRVFETATGQEVSTLFPDHGLRAIYFAEQGRSLVAASVVESIYSTSDVVVSRYPLRQMELIDDACSRVTRNLTEAEWKQYVGAEVPYGETCGQR